MRFQLYLTPLLLILIFCETGLGQTYPIGTQTITYQDPARSNRNIQTYLYYPAVSAGANTAVATGTFPVVVIGHGFTMNYTPYTYLADTLVPKGYIVAIPNTETGFSPSHSEFAADLAFLVSKLYSENSNNASAFYQHVQLSSCIAGHSMGGGCTILAAASNSNVTCTATLALAETNPSAIAAAANVTAPSLVFSGSDDCVTPPASNQTPAYNNLPGCKAQITIIDGGHCNFATSNFNCNFGEMTCNPGGPALPAATQRALTCRFLVPWLDRFLKSNGNAGVTFNARFNSSVTSGAISGTIQCLVLPLELLDFAGEMKNNQVHLRWRTAHESGTGFFEVEKSTDGQYYQPIGRVTAQGNCTQCADYEYIDRGYSAATQYYRLRMVDRNGVEQYSPIVSVQHGEKTALRIWPNPASDQITVSWEETVPATALRVYDWTGRLVLSQPVDPAAFSAIIQTETWGKGLYWIEAGMSGSSVLVR